MGSRRQAREQALQLLYQLDLAPAEPQKVMRHFWEAEPADPDVVEFVRDLVGAVQNNQDRIDELISKASTNWKLPRMSYVDRNVLRLGVAEFIARDDIPPMVSINEAIELGKKFGTTESGAFINGILDRIARNLKLTAKS
jgi:transcription antitermination protein NusB